MITRRSILIVGLAAAGFAGAARATGAVRQQSLVTPAPMLYEGATLEQTATEGESHRYEVSLRKDEFLELTVSQTRLVIELSVRDAEGAAISSICVPDIDPLPQHLLLLGSVSGRYSITVTTVAGGSAHADSPAVKQSGPSPISLGYELRVVALRPATPTDRERVRWFDVLQRAVAQERLGTMEGLRQAVPLYEEAARGWESTGDLLLEVATLDALAHMTGYFIETNRESIRAREQLAALYPYTDERQLEAHNLRSLGTEYLEAGRLEDAKDVVTRALDVSLAQGLRGTAAASQRHLGVYEFELGNYEPAREHALRAQEQAASIGDRGLEALTLWDLSRLDAVAGDFDAAIARSTRALDLAEGNASATNVLTMWLGFYHLSRGELDAAESFFETRLKAARRTVQRDQEAFTRLGLADVKLARGDREAARQGYEAAALALDRGLHYWRCFAQQRLARLDLQGGQLDQAAGRFETMRDIAVGRQQPGCEAEARAGLADVAVRRGDLARAEVEARRVVDLTETFRQAVVSVESRSVGFGALAPAYERAIDISMRRATRNDDEAVVRALTLNEQALARGLLDRVAESHLDSRARVEPALAEHHRRVRERWRARLAELEVAMRLRPTAPETNALVEETRTLAVEVRDLDAKIDAADPRRASFLRPRPPGLAAIQGLLDDDTLLLEYALGESRSFLWVVSNRAITPFTLAPRAEIETLARRVHGQLARPPDPATRPQRQPHNPIDDRLALSRLVVAPAASLLSAKRLVLVLPGALSLVPFDALPVTGPDLMIARYEIVQVPSATTLAAMRALTTGRPPPAKVAAVFADPIYDGQDPRVRGRSAVSRPAPVIPVSRVAGLSLTRLPFSRDEAQEISALAPGSVASFLGFDATRERAIDRELFDYRFIHFATHAVMNERVPSLSSVVLSLVDRAGRPRDGFVMLPDVYDMTLNADVVVLSGCQTALGRQVRGEGPIGLARGFMYAGVPRVVASLWQVDDLATAELMRRFYRGVLVEGLTPAAALRAAQQKLAGTRRWQSPYLWAAFVLQGDWR